MAPPFPHDLIDLQCDWIRTYEALARLAPTQSTTGLRHRLLGLSCALAAHPYWTRPGCSPAERVALLRQARAAHAYAWVTAA